MSGNPILVRGTLYPSQRAAARALGVSETNVCHHLRRGTPDLIGLAGPRDMPETFCDRTFRSRSELSIFLGRNRAYVTALLSRCPDGRARLEALVKEKLHDLQHRD